MAPRACVRVYARVCWCRRIFTYIHTYLFSEPRPIESGDEAAQCVDGVARRAARDGHLRGEEYEGVVKRSTGHTHTHTPTENHTRDTDIHAHDKNNTPNPQRTPPINT